MAAEFRASPTAVAGSTWVIAPSLQDGREPTAWTSTDDGATWNTYPIGDNQAAEPAFAEERMGTLAPDHATWDIAATPLGLLLTGRYDFGEDHANLLHYSTDGTDWQLCATPRTSPGEISATAADFTEIVMLGDILILLDAETGGFYTWNDTNTRP